MNDPADTIVANLRVLRDRHLQLVAQALRAHPGHPELDALVLEIVRGHVTIAWDAAAAHVRSCLKPTEPSHA